MRFLKVYIVLVIGIFFEQKTFLSIRMFSSNTHTFDKYLKQLKAAAVYVSRV